MTKEYKEIWKEDCKYCNGDVKTVLKIIRGGLFK